MDILSNIDVTKNGNDFYYIFETRWKEIKKIQGW